MQKIINQYKLILTKNRLNGANRVSEQSRQIISQIALVAMEIMINKELILMKLVDRAFRSSRDQAKRLRKVGFRNS